MDKIKQLTKKQHYVPLILITCVIAYLCAMNSLLALLIFGVVVMILLAVNHWGLILLLIIIINESLFYLVDFDNLNQSGLYNIKDLSYGLIFILIFMYYLNRKKQIKLNFSKEILIFIVLVMIEIINSFNIYGQPVVLGFRASRFCFLYLIYFPMSQILSQNNSKAILKNIIIFMGFIAATLNIVQYLLPSKQILYLTLNERYDSVSVSVSIYLIIISFFLLCSKVFDENIKTNKFTNLFLGGVNLFALIFVTKTRIVLVGIFFALGVLIFIQKKYSKKIILYIVIILFTLTFPYLGNSIVGKAYDLTKHELSSNSGNYGVRLTEYNFYVTQALKTPLLGRGILNILHPQSLIALGTENSMYLSDIGIFGMFFNYGIAGILWYLFLLKKIYQKLIFLYRRNNLDYGVLGYVLFITVTGITAVVIDHPSVIIYNAIVLALLDADVKEVDGGNYGVVK